MANELPLQMLIYEDEEGKPYTIYVQSQDADLVDPDRLQEKEPSGDRPGRRFGDIPIDEEAKKQAKRRAQQAIQTLRGSAGLALRAFRDLGGAEVAEINLEFALKFAGKTGVPMVTEGSAETNMKIQVKLKFPDKNSD
jgi:hypothetical protein